MSKELEDFRVIKFKTINAGYDYGYKVWDKIEQALLKAQEQEKVLKIIKEKPLSLLVLNLLKTYGKDEVFEHNYQTFIDCYKTAIRETFKEEDIKEQIATEEEFNLLKKYVGKGE